MSHYSLMAINRKGRHDLDRMLAPYDEAREVAPYIRKTRAEALAEYREDIRRAALSLKAAEGKTEEEYQEARKGNPDLFANYDYVVGGDRCAKRAAQANLTDEELMPYLEDYYGAELDAEGNVLSTYNPDSKWDWYEVGGRWSDELILKDGSRADSAKAKDIDWDAMYSLTPLARAQLSKKWDDIACGPDDKEHGEYLIKEYGPFHAPKEALIRRYGSGEEGKAAYLKACAVWTAYAVLDQAGWHEAGEMGWFGISAADEEAQIKWRDGFRKAFVDTLDPEDEVTIVDLHI